MFLIDQKTGLDALITHQKNRNNVDGPFSKQIDLNIGKPKQKWTFSPFFQIFFFKTVNLYDVVKDSMNCIDLLNQIQMKLALFNEKK